VICRTWGTVYGDDFAGRFLFDEPLFVVAALDSPWSRRSRIDLADLMGEPWALPASDTIVGMLIGHGLERAGSRLPQPQVVSNSVTVRIRLVESAGFLTLLPLSMLHFGADRLKLKALRVKLPLESHPVEIIALRNRTLNPVAELFIKELHALVQTMTKSGDEPAQRPRSTRKPASRDGRG